MYIGPFNISVKSSLQALTATSVQILPENEIGNITVILLIYCMYVTLCMYVCIYIIRLQVYKYMYVQLKSIPTKLYAFVCKYA